MLCTLYTYSGKLPDFMVLIAVQWSRAQAMRSPQHPLSPLTKPTETLSFSRTSLCAWGSSIWGWRWILCAWEWCHPFYLSNGELQAEIAAWLCSAWVFVTVTSFLQTAPGCLHREHHARYTVHSNGRGGLEGNPGAASHSVKVENLPGA